MYNSFYQSPYLPMQRQELIRVNGLDGAKAYQMMANSVVALFDANADLMYIKSTDGAGFPSIRVFSFSEQVQNDAPVQNGSGETYSQILQTLDEIKEMLSNGKQSVRSKQDTKSAE